MISTPVLRMSPMARSCRRFGRSREVTVLELTSGSASEAGFRVFCLRTPTPMALGTDPDETLRGDECSLEGWAL